jgi:DNA polymerase III subunit gamma/tau
MSEVYFNLARKWRPKQCDDLIGQSLVVRLIKNSLYRNLIFPVYLFAGTKGCGKTSMARLFASALNCTQLVFFQKDPQSVKLPCLVCTSCMQRMNHPDVIELDAASHTGVDTIRHIIDSSSFIPALGTRKIYIIDEAHMLSKAAFNALLKILEEPPPSVVFMLATTDASKVIDTVKSRCFQLFFYPIGLKDLSNHLEMICKQEAIPYDKEGLMIIAQEAEGSVRDALNIIERIRLSHESITKATVREVLGFIDDEQLCLLFKAVVEKNLAAIFQWCLDVGLDRFNAPLMLKKIIELIRVGLWIKNGLSVPYDKLVYKQLKAALSSCTQDHLIAMFEVCYTYEPLLAKTAMPAVALEMVLIKLAEVGSESPSQSTLSLNSGNSRSSLTLEEPTRQVQPHDSWKSYVHELENLKDPLVLSIFKQGVCEHIDRQEHTIKLIFGRDLTFFQEWLTSTKPLWQPILEKFFGPAIKLIADFTGEPTKLPVFDTPALVTPPVKVPSKIPAKPPTRVATTVIKEQHIDISNVKKWARAHLLLKIFPGTVKIKSNSVTNLEVS